MKSELYMYKGNYYSWKCALEHTDGEILIFIIIFYMHCYLSYVASELNLHNTFIKRIYNHVFLWSIYLHSWCCFYFLVQWLLNCKVIARVRCFSSINPRCNPYLQNNKSAEENYTEWALPSSWEINPLELNNTKRPLCVI